MEDQKLEPDPNLKTMVNDYIKILNTVLYILLEIITSRDPSNYAVKALTKFRTTI